MLEHILPRPGRHPKVPHPRRALVVGAGLAGLANAIVLAERGVQVTLLEKSSYLGGRLGAWTDQLQDGESFQMERGFHAFFRQYYNLRALLKRFDPELSMLEAMRDYPILGPGGQRESFTGLPTKAPWNLIAMTWRSPTLRLRDLPRIDRDVALEMLRFDRQHSYQKWDAHTAKDYLDQLKFPPEARRMLFEVFCHSFFNPEQEMSAAELLMMFHFYFVGNPEGLIFDVARQPFCKAILEPLERYFESLGGQVLRDCPIQRVISLPDTQGFELIAPTQVLRADWLTLALDLAGLKKLIEASPGLGDAHFRQQIDALELTAPFSVWRLWLDGPLRPDRAPFAGTVGLGLIDNISLFHLLEDESRQWAQRHGGSVVELHAYGVDPELDEQRIKDELLAGLHECYPETRSLKILEERWLHRQDCPSFAPGSDASRPRVDSGPPGLTLAGDFCRLPLPSALMERAVMSGILAANHQLALEEVQPETIFSIAQRGWLAPKSRREEVRA